MTDSGAVRAILAIVAVALIATVLYLVSLSAHPGIERIQPVPRSVAPPGPVAVDALVRAGHPIEHVMLSIDGAQVLPSVQPQSDRAWEISYETVFSRGQHLAEVTVIDNTGAVQRHDWSFTASGPKIAPAISFAGPPAGLEYQAGTLRLHAVIQTDSALKTAVLTINGEPVAVKPVAQTTGPSDTPAYDITLHHDFTPGAYVVQLSVTDDLQQQGQAQWSLLVVADQAAATAWYYPESDAYLYGPFKTFWQKNGGQKIFGAPVGDQYVTAGGTTVQYFTNARLELQPDGSVGLGRLGAEAFDQVVPRVDNPNRPDVAYFAATGHTLQGSFKSFWEQNGGLPIFGYPISEVLDEDGTKVQYFERARFELVPSGNAAQPSVRLTPLGAQIWSSLQSSAGSH